MKTAAAAALVVGLLVSAPATAEAQAVILVVDAGPVRLNLDALRARIGEVTGRRIVRLGEDGSRHASETLTIARAGAQRWVILHNLDGRTVWSESHDVRPGAVQQRLARAAVLALSATPTPEPADIAGANQWSHGTEPDADLLDPFMPRRWDALRATLGAEIVDPFERGITPTCLSLVDPFAAERAFDLLDPWAAL